MLTLSVIIGAIWFVNALYKDYTNNKRLKKSSIEEQIRKERFEKEYAEEQKNKELFFKSLNCSNIVIIDGVQAVDLGLGDEFATPYWAVSNIGASSQFDSGTVFGWGMIEPAEHQLIHCYSMERKSKLMSKNYDEFDALGGDGSYKGECEYDAATNQLGYCWFTPDYNEVGDLLNNCHWELIDKYGVYGWKVIGPNNNFIFIPIQKKGDSSAYLTSSAIEDDSIITCNECGKSKQAYFLEVLCSKPDINKPLIKEQARVRLGYIRPFSYGEGVTFINCITEEHPIKIK